jgi:hypothetical protein
VKQKFVEHARTHILSPVLAVFPTKKPSSLWRPPLICLAGRQRIAQSSKSKRLERTLVKPGLEADWNMMVFIILLKSMGYTHGTPPGLTKLAERTKGQVCCSCTTTRRSSLNDSFGSTPLESTCQSVIEDRYQLKKKYVHMYGGNRFID